MVDTHARNGSFDTLRLVAALLVFHSHSFALVGRPEPGVPGFAFGTWAVIMFFAMSGYWVARSAVERGLLGFSIARALRIVPGLFVCCLVTIGVCALATSEPVNTYLREPDTWRWLKNALPFWLPQRGALPGVFEDGAIHNPNGSLWTLPYEVFCYVVVGVAGAFGPKGVRVAIAGAAVYAAVTLLSPQSADVLTFTSVLQRGPLAHFAIAFFFGALASSASNRQLAGIIVGSAVAMYLTPSDATLMPVACILCYASLVLWLGRVLNLDRHVTRGRDISYGVYIYAFPLQQLAIRALPPDQFGFAAAYAAALVATIAFAALSWVLVERPALGLKQGATDLIERQVGRIRRRLTRATTTREPV